MLVEECIVDLIIDRTAAEPCLMDLAQTLANQRVERDEAAAEEVDVALQDLEEEMEAEEEGEEEAEREPEGKAKGTDRDIYGEMVSAERLEQLQQARREEAPAREADPSTVEPRRQMYSRAP